MARTIRRQPIQLSTSSSNYPQPYHFNQAQFKGLSTEQNDITIDQQTFADVNNLYIDENGVLVSRLPFKFDGTDAYIVERWDFGRYHLMLQRFLCKQSGDDFVQVDDTGEDNLFFVFKLSCYTSDTLDECTWSFPVSTTGSDYFPEVTCSQVEDKIFVWFAGIDFICFNTVQSTFEDAEKYIYLPIRELMMNGIPTEFESENFLTQNYRRRHQLSAVSDIDYSTLYNKHVSVYYKTAHLYDTIVKPSLENALIHPSFFIGDYYTDFVETPRGLVILRCAQENISISFGTGKFHNIPKPYDTYSEPILTRDGLCIIAFTSQGLAKYELPTTDVENGTWVYERYPTSLYQGGTNPLYGYFETADIYVYTYNDVNGKLHLFSQVSAGTDGFKQNDVTLDKTVINDFDYFDLRVKGNLTLSLGSKPTYKLYLFGRNTNTHQLKTIKLVLYQDGTTFARTENVYEVELNTKLSNCGISIYSDDEVFFSGNFFVNGNNVDRHFLIRTNNTNEGVLGTYEIDMTSHKFINDNLVCITDKYLYSRVAGHSAIPNNIAKKDILVNGDRITVDGFSVKVRFISTDYPSGQSKSGSNIYCVESAYTNKEYVEPPNYINTNNTFHTTGYVNPIFSIEKLTVVDGEFVVVEGDIHSGDFVRLKASTESITGYNTYRYPNTPDGWSIGDEWPTTFPPYKPHYPEPDGTIRAWKVGDPLPEGYVEIYGDISVEGDIIPQLVGEDNWYTVGGRTWTSALEDDTLLDIDEYVNVNVGVNKVPSHIDVMNEYYFSYDVNNEHLLEVTEARRDEKTHNDFLLYLPKKNEQKFSSKITALHHLSDSEMGIFTENEIWYTSVGTLNDTVVYTKPIRSKIPTGLRDGDEVVTALDGQAVIFPSERGLVALAPQDFIATTEKTLSYISDSIQSLYQELYKSDIRIDTYKYFLLFHRRFGRDIIAFDTRNSSWWRWQTPYPIRSLFTNDGLRPLLQIDFRGTKPSLLGIPYVLRNDITYTDDIVENSLNGNISKVYENEQVGERIVYHRAEPIINWWFTSQKLHFDQINNYKSVKSINLNLNESAQIKLSTKAYRDMSHPEQDDVFDVKVNEIRTFVKRVNLMHVMHFQYRLENDRYVEVPQQFKLNSLSIKYEVKERIR